VAGIRVDGHVTEVRGDIAFVVVGDPSAFAGYETSPPELSEILEEAGVDGGEEAVVEVVRADSPAARPKRLRGRLTDKEMNLCLGETMFIDFFQEFMGERVFVSARKADPDAETARVTDPQTVSF
jgi:hypothetical protein